MDKDILFAIFSGITLTGVISSFMIVGLDKFFNWIFRNNYNKQFEKICKVSYVGITLVAAIISLILYFL